MKYEKIANSKITPFIQRIVLIDKEILDQRVNIIYNFYNR